MSSHKINRRRYTLVPDAASTVSSPPIIPAETQPQDTPARLLPNSFNSPKLGNYSIKTSTTMETANLEGSVIRNINPIPQSNSGPQNNNSTPFNNNSIPVRNNSIPRSPTPQTPSPVLTSTSPAPPICPIPKSSTPLHRSASPLPRSGSLVPRGSSPVPESISSVARPVSPAPQDQRNPCQCQIQDGPNMQASCTVMAFISTMWKRGLLFDCEIITQDKTAYAHKMVLAAYSELALDTFTQPSPNFEKSAQQHVLDLSEFSYGPIEAIITFLYTAAMDLTDATVRDVLRAAKKLRMSCVVAFCLHYLSQFTIDNCLLYYEICEACNENLACTIYNFICRNFEKVSQTKSFLLTSKETALKILREDHLRISSELVILDAAVRWLEVDQTNRNQFAGDLLDCFRVPLVSPEEIVTKVEKHSFLTKVPGAAEKLYRAMCYHSLCQSNQPLARQYAAAPRSCAN